MLIFLVQKFNQNDLANNPNTLRRICISFSIVVSIFLDTAPPVCSAECQDALWDICTQVGLLTHNPAPFLTGENWVSLLFFSETWMVGTSCFRWKHLQIWLYWGSLECFNIQNFAWSSLDAGVWFSTIPLHWGDFLLTSVFPSWPGYTEAVLQNNEVFSHLDSVATFSPFSTGINAEYWKIKDQEGISPVGLKQ